MNDFQAKYLAEFNHIVLAGHEREGNYGVEFVTWEGIMKQIEEAVPQVIDLANELTQYPQQHRSGEMQLY